MIRPFFKLCAFCNRKFFGEGRRCEKHNIEYRLHRLQIQATYDAKKRRYKMGV